MIRSLSKKPLASVSVSTLKGATMSAQIHVGGGISLEADVGIKDGQGKQVFSPHAVHSDIKGANDASHVEEHAQVSILSNLHSVSIAREVLLSSIRIENMVGFESSQHKVWAGESFQKNCGD